MTELRDLGFVVYVDDTQIHYKDCSGKIRIAYKAEGKDVVSCKKCKMRMIRKSPNQKCCKSCAELKNRKCRRNYYTRMKRLKKSDPNN